MYSEIVNDSGISQHTMEIMVFGGIGIFVLGVVFYLWWKQIMIGFLALVALVVLANHRPTKSVVPKVEQEQIIIEVEKPVIQSTPIQQDVDPQPANEEELVTKPEEELVTKPEEELVIKPENDREYFIEDCLQFTDYNKAQCEAIWDKEDTPEIDTSETELLDIEIVEYKERRAKALKKPNAVVAHYTLR
jgi:hypothetical protein